MTLNEDMEYEKLFSTILGIIHTRMNLGDWNVGDNPITLRDTSQIRKAPEKKA